MKIILVLDNIRSCYNVGAILRTAEGFGVEKVILSGYTPRVHDQNLLPHLRDKQDKAIAKTALGAEDMLNIYSSGDIISEVKKYHKQEYTIIGLENNLSDDRLRTLDNLNLPPDAKVLLILGEEVHGIDKSLYETIDIFAEIPMCGQKESFNVSVAAGIALYGIMYS